MRTRRLGSTAMELTEIGFGAWAIGGGDWQFGWGAQDDQEAIDAIHAALDQGINWIDTAPVYGLGHSEQLVGQALHGRRHAAFIATKCSLVWDAQGNIANRLTRASVRAECEASLGRLQTDHIDLYQIHWPVDEPHIEQGWEEIGRLIAEGKVRYGGVSNFAPTHLQRVHGLRPAASLQPRYSMLHREVERGVLDNCRELGVGVVVYSPLASGLLSGHFDRARLASNDWRRAASEFNEPELSANLQLVDSLRPIAARNEKTVSQLAIAWVLRRAEVTSAIVGARRPSQVAETAAGAGWTIPPADLAEIENLLERRSREIPESAVQFR